MPRVIQLSDARAEVQRLADLENDSHISSTVLNGFINAARAEYWERLVAAFPEYYRREQTITGGSMDNAVPSDYFGTLGVGYLNGGRLTPLKEIPFHEEWKYNRTDTGISTAYTFAYNSTDPESPYLRLLVTPNGGDTYIHSYTIQPTQLSSDTDEIYDVNNMTQIVWVKAAILTRIRQALPSTQLENELQRQLARLDSMIANRRIGYQGRVADHRGVIDDYDVDVSDFRFNRP